MRASVAIRKFCEAEKFNGEIFRKENFPHGDFAELIDVEFKPELSTLQARVTALEAALKHYENCVSIGGRFIAREALFHAQPEGEVRK